MGPNYAPGASRSRSAGGHLGGAAQRPVGEKRRPPVGVVEACQRPQGRVVPRAGGRPVGVTALPCSTTKGRREWARDARPTAEGRVVLAATPAASRAGLSRAATGRAAAAGTTKFHARGGAHPRAAEIPLWQTAQWARQHGPARGPRGMRAHPKEQPWRGPPVDCWCIFFAAAMVLSRASNTW